MSPNKEYGELANRLEVFIRQKHIDCDAEKILLQMEECWEKLHENEQLRVSRWQIISAIKERVREAKQNSRLEIF